MAEFPQKDFSFITNNIPLQKSPIEQPFPVWKAEKNFMPTFLDEKLSKSAQDRLKNK